MASGGAVSDPVLELAGPWRFDQLAGLPDDGRRYEVVDGNLLVTQPPSQDHQVVGSRLRDQLAVDCPREWEVVQEYALPLGTDGRVPDLAVVRRRPLGTDRALYPQGPEDFGLVVEVTSPSTRKADLFAKPGEYAAAGIALFWRVELDPALVIRAYRLGAGAYVEAAVADGPGGLCPVPWGDVPVDLARIRTG